MKILIVDSKGGGLGKLLIEACRDHFQKALLAAVGTNALATATMLKAKPDFAVTGENAIRVNAADADFILGPVGIAIANSIHGEISPAMALAIAESRAVRILLPINQCETYIVGRSSLTMEDMISEAMKDIKELMESGNYNRHGLC